MEWGAQHGGGGGGLAGAGRVSCSSKGGLEIAGRMERAFRMPGVASCGSDPTPRNVI